MRLCKVRHSGEGNIAKMSSIMELAVRVALLAIVINCVNLSYATAATIDAVSCSQSHVQAAVNSASNGDTVIVPVGTCSWSSPVSISNKTITVMGAGKDQTIISGSPAFYLTGTNSSRISGFTIDYTGGSYGIQINVGPTGWRIDKCKISNTSTGWGYGVYGYGDASNSPAGLIDNCELINGRILFYGENYGTFKPNGCFRYSEPLELGSNNAIYVEDCVFERTLPNEVVNAVDTNIGGRFVFRFNTVENLYAEFHSVQGNNRAGRLFEIYNNTWDMESGYSHYKPVRLRGGTGVLWGNELTGSWNHRDIAFDNIRSYDDVSPGGLCDGSSPWDGNQDSTGWPCRDQIGRSTDQWLWTQENPYPPQASAPVYLWLNRDMGNIMAASVINSSENHIKNNRDYYQEVSAFNGSSGTGYGTLAERPTTCTPGVAYWATDQGNWNKSGSGEQGVLYKCTAPNTWSLYYTPYAYPHPLRGESEIPNAPTGFKILP